MTHDNLTRGPESTHRLLILNPRHTLCIRRTSQNNIASLEHTAWLFAGRFEGSFLHSKEPRPPQIAWHISKTRLNLASAKALSIWHQIEKLVADESLDVGQQLCLAAEHYYGSGSAVSRWACVEAVRRELSSSPRRVARLICKSVYLVFSRSPYRSPLTLRTYVRNNPKGVLPATFSMQICESARRPCFLFPHEDHLQRVLLNTCSR